MQFHCRLPLHHSLPNTSEKIGREGSMSELKQFETFSYYLSQEGHGHCISSVGSSLEILQCQVMIWRNATPALEVELTKTHLGLNVSSLCQHGVVIQNIRVQNIDTGCAGAFDFIQESNTLYSWSCSRCTHFRRNSRCNPPILFQCCKSKICLNLNKGSGSRARRRIQTRVTCLKYSMAMLD